MTSSTGKWSRRHGDSKTSTSFPIGVTISPPLKESAACSENNNTCVITRYFANVLKLSSFFGVAPLCFEAHDQGIKISLSRAKWIYSSIPVAILGTCSILGKITELYFSWKNHVQGSAIQLVYAYLVWSMMLLCGVCVFGSFKRLKNMLQYINTIALVDISVSTRNPSTKERNLFVVIILYLTCVTGIYIYAGWSLSQRSWIRCFSMTCTHLVSYALTATNLQFLFLNMQVCARFQAINEALIFITKQLSISCCTKLPTKLPNFPASTKPKPDTRAQVVLIRNSVSAELSLVVSPSTAIYRIAYLRGMLYKMVHNINKGYGLPNIITIVTIIGNITVTAYIFIDNLNTPGTLLKSLTINLFFLTTNLSIIFILVEPCHYILRESTKTKRILCRMISTPIPNTMLFLLEMFSHQVMLQPVLYEPLHMCILNRWLFVSLFGAITTCIVVLIRI